MGFLTALPSGSKLRASALEARYAELRPLRATLAASQDFTSTTTLADLTGFSLTLAASTEYEIELHAIATSVANAAGDVKYAFTLTGGTFTAHIAAAGPHNSLASGTQSDLESFAVRSMTASPTTSFPFGTSTTETMSSLYGRIITGSAAITLQVQAAQQSSSGNKTTVLQHSYLIAKKAA